MDNLTFEQKIAALVCARTPQEKADLISRWANDPAFHYGLNGKTMPLEKYMAQDKFKAVANQNKEIKKNQRNNGWNRSKTQKHIASIPADVFFNRPELNAHLPQKQFAENIRKFLRDFPAFKVSE
jgi:hypothetical protein